MVSLIFKLVVCDLPLLSRLSLDKDILYTKLMLSIRLFNDDNYIYFFIDNYYENCERN